MTHRLALVVVVLASLAACGDKDGAKPEPAASAQPAAATTAKPTGAPASSAQPAASTKKDDSGW
jgi:hypothetical protein